MLIGCLVCLLLASAAQASSFLNVNVTSLVIRDGSDWSKDPLFLTICLSSPGSSSCDIGRGWITGYEYAFPPVFMELQANNETRILFNITVHTAEDIIANDVFETTIGSLMKMKRQRINTHTAMELVFGYYTEIRFLQEHKFTDARSSYAIANIIEKHCDAYCKATVGIMLFVVLLFFMAAIMICIRLCNHKVTLQFPPHDTTGSAEWLFGEKQPKSPTSTENALSPQPTSEIVEDGTRSILPTETIV